MRDILWTSSILILGILGIRFFMKGRISPILQYALWLLVVFRLILPIPLWSSQLSVLNLIPQENEKQETAAQHTKTRGMDMPGWINWGLTDTERQQAGADGGLTDMEGGLAGAVGGLADTERQQAGAVGSLADMEDSQLGADGALIDTEGSQTEAGKSPLVAEGNPTDIAGSQTEIAENRLSTDDSRTKVQVLADTAVQCLPFIWLGGILLMGGYMLLYQVKWKRYLRQNRKPWKNGRKYRDCLNVYTVEGLPSPCLSGRSIYLTQEMTTDAKQLEHILTHEYCHYRHLDSLWVIVRCVLLTVYWFHPLVWAAAYASKQDGELACDEAVIRLLGEKERIPYGKTLLHLIAGDFHDKSKIGIASTMSSGEKGIRERISRIAGKNKYVTVVSVSAILLAAVFVIATFSGTKQENDAAYGQEESGQEDLRGQEGFSGQKGLSAQGNAAGMEDLSADAKAQGVLQNTELLQEGQMSEGAKQQNPENAGAESQSVEYAEQASAAEQEMNVAETEAVLTRLHAYDEDVTAIGSGEGIFGIANAKIPSDYVQAYAEQGEEALEEGMYLLETVKGSDASDIRVYGMYTKEYGCMGLKMIIGDNCNNFAEAWQPSGLSGLDGNLRVYDSTQDGMPRTFAMKILNKNTSDSEIWKVYVCDCYDTGKITMKQFEPQEYLAQINERLTFTIRQSEGKIDVYDREEKVGGLTLGSDAAAMKEIKEVVIDGSVAGWELGGSLEELRLITAVGLKLETGQVWYRGLSLLSFPVECGDFGNRAFTLGQVEVEGSLINPMIQDSLEQAFQTTGVHNEVELIFQNPCPAYTRISDEFGVRVNPVTGEERTHNGVDFAAPEGSDVLAAAEGKVYQTGFDAANGNYIVLFHVLSGEYTYYTCCQDILVTEGETVSKGEKIATVGSTGMSTGAHLHFALSRDGEYVEPVWK
ncbi:MAG: M23/M56 family metallopeptidase [Blautia sp.]|nr:M23/M56 family metallopeptidase [Lachnoclostridium sp.]MCM1210548.1 M23/M56 family metallopeptidase [Blautia sp.]